jgi:hypothetical protein
MKRTFLFTLAALAVAVSFAGAVYAVLLAAHAAEPAAATIHGVTLRRLWATAAVAVGLVGTVVGGVSLAGIRRGTWSPRRGQLVALGAGLVAAANGLVNLAVATGGPGTGNGVVGGAAALVLGVVALCLAAPALLRQRHRAPGPSAT